MWSWNNFYIDLKELKRSAQYIKNWQLFVMIERVHKKRIEISGEKDNNRQLFITEER